MHAFSEDGFAAALLDPDLPVPTCIKESDGATRKDRFAVYRNSVVQGLVDALATGFPVVQQSVGESFFAAAARLFVERNPPRGPIMASYGEAFPAFLADFAPCAELPYLPDLARLEAARTRAYHAADATPLPAEAFTRLTSEHLADLRLRLHPSLFILSSRFPVATIFAMNSGELPLQEIEDWQGEDVLVARPGMIVETRRLPLGSAAFLSRLAEDATLAEAAEGALAIAPQFDLAGALAGAIGLGLITQISTPSPLE